MPAEALAKRVLGSERLELADELPIPAESEVDLDAQLERGKPDLLEPRDRRLGEALVGDVRERRSPPQRQRLPQPIGGVACLPVREALPRVVDQPLEPVEVELIRPQTDHVAGRLRGEGIRRKRLAKARHVDTERSAACLGRILPPEVVDQTVGGNDLVRVQEKGGEESTLLRAAEPTLAALVPNL